MPPCASGVKLAPMMPTTRALILRPHTGVMPVVEGAIQYRPNRFACVESFRAGPWLVLRLMRAALRGEELRIAEAAAAVWPVWRDVEEAAFALQRMGIADVRWAQR
jgi:hypothetical protein